MSWLATKYAWKCRHKAVKGSVRLVLLAIALRVRKSYADTSPTSLSVLKRLTFLSDDAIRAAIDTLVEVGEVRRVHRGKNAVYAMARMAGPLFAENPQDAAFFEDEKNPQDAAFLHRKMREFSVAPAGGVLSSEGTGTRVPTTAENPIAAQLAAEAEDFLEFFCVEYLTRRGCPYRQRHDEALAVIRELLRDRDLERLKVMARLMFAATRDQFIVTSDYSLFVLRHKATYLENIIVGNERREAHSR